MIMAPDTLHPITIKRRGMMLILSSPSGAGKTSIARELVARDNNLMPSISVTTRPQRPGEIDGEDYFFISQDKFQHMVDHEQLLEHAFIFGNYYGTPRDTVIEKLGQGRDLMFDIDWQGARQLTENAREDLVTVFVLPPSREELEKRLRKRAQDSDDVIRLRMSKAPDEMSHYPEYDYVIVNYDFESSVKAVHSILLAERAKRVRQMGLAQFVHGLQHDVEEAVRN